MQDLLLECIARAAFEATEIAFDFGSASLETIDRKGHATRVQSDADCRRVRGANGLRISTRAPLLRSSVNAVRTSQPPVGSLLHASEDEDEESEIIL